MRGVGILNVRVRVVAGAFLLLAAGIARADYDAADPGFDAPFLTNYSYDSADFVIAGHDYAVSNLTMYDLNGEGALPTDSLHDSLVTTTYDYSGLIDSQRMSGTGGITIRVHYDSAGNFTDTVESMTMDGSGDGHTIKFQYDSSTPESETVTTLGGGQFQVHSFFDVFTELSIDGGGFVAPSSGSANGHFGFTPSPTPEPITIGLALAGLGMAVKRVRRRT